MSPRAIKKRLRAEVVGRILSMDPADRARQQATLEAMFPSLPGYEGAGTVLLYAHAFPEEIRTSPFLADALTQGKRLACPRVDRAVGGLVLHAIVDPARDFAPGVLAIPEPVATCPVLEPEAIDWVLVPGLAFDGRGYRLGRGAGHYDRLLARLRPEAGRWALAFDSQWVDELPVEPHDQRLDGVVSPGRTAFARRLG